MRRLILGIIAIALLAPVTVSAHQTATTPHVLLVILENKGYQKTLGTCSADPYFCSLAKTYASVTGWTGIGHPSLPNYLAVTSGSTQGCHGDSCPTGKYHGDLMAQLNTAAIPFRLYMESMPGACATHDSGNYVVHHNPGPYFADSQCKTTDLPYPGASGLVSVLDGASPPDFVWITPNIKNDMHSGSVSAGDRWLKANLAGVLSSPWFVGGTVVVTMDEGDNGGNAIPMVVISGNAAGKGNVAMAGNHYWTLGAIESAFGVPLLGKAVDNSTLEALFG